MHRGHAGVVGVPPSQCGSTAVNALDPTAFATLLLFANLLCLVLVAVNLQEATQPQYRDGCSECSEAKRGREDAEMARRQKEIELIREERERRKRETEDDDRYRWR